MLELLNESLRLVNLPFTFLVIVVVIYWLLMILGVVGIDSLDADSGGLDLDADADVDMDLEVGGDGDTVAAPAHGIMAGALSFVNADRVPLAIVLSFFFVFLWIGMILGNHFVNPGKSILLGIVIFVPVYVGAVLATKVVTLPFVKFFGHLKSGGDAPVSMIGKTCRLLNNIEGDRIGQVEIVTEGAPWRLNVRAFRGEKLALGSEAVIVEHNREKGYFIVKGLDMPLSDEEDE